MSSKVPTKEVPEYVYRYDSEGRIISRYMRNKFLGKGGFAKVYEFIDMDTQEKWAVKAVAMALLTKSHQRQKMKQEIAIHRRLSNKHVVQFHDSFQDEDFVYVILELCKNRSLMELHKRRRTISEPEARYFMHQFLLGCQYMHDQNVIHRDLKLGNLFLNDKLEVKIGDFGLATVCDRDGEKKKTLCGTPNYIAPEMLRKEGHSYEVDVWAVGCVIYTLLVGKPPFETNSLRETYHKIKHNEYRVPSRVSSSAAEFIHLTLQQDPTARPSIMQLMTHRFFSDGFCPAHLPSSVLSTAPRQSEVHTLPRQPLVQANPVVAQFQAPVKVEASSAARFLKPLPEGQPVNYNDGGGDVGRTEAKEGKDDFYLAELQLALANTLKCEPSKRAQIRMADAEDPKFSPIYWVAKWVDYSDKYGLGYQLNDNSVGVIFNDNSKLVLNKDHQQMQYLDRDGKEAFYLFNGTVPQELAKKVTLLRYFLNYMNEHLIKTGEHVPIPDGEELTRLPYLNKWFRTRSAICLHLTNGTLQMNFFEDHVKLILCPLMLAVTVIGEDSVTHEKTFKTYPLRGIEKCGCDEGMV